MVLKRQTVWLLTMLSLIIVLSVYYITAPPQNEQLAYLGENGEVVEESETDSSFVEFEEVTETTMDGLFDEEILTGFTNDEAFNSIRLERQMLRDRLSEDYTAVIASSDASADLQSQAWDNIESLRVLAQKEEMLETLIKTKGYEDVLVIAEDNEVKIIVKADELSSEEGIKIMHMAKEQLNIKDVAVAFQPNN
ncbi:hypothetical protein BKP37_04210 [Anaerobacillus alkalilacustris]|uniref:Stage III sporulation protein AH n=1 Tax=Anaerobacillus alkalilacustris TaxID=393763 RepID=A0A1S2LWE0_9BACI|nr:SpoIIIAH-like family protein [Anaerobacillus alkalilacustris]OIJ16871.1 hypothetical protein BKP37_04210 [Anaerobacillus alkalilacustris]